MQSMQTYGERTAATYGCLDRRKDTEQRAMDAQYLAWRLKVDDATPARYTTARWPHASSRRPSRPVTPSSPVLLPGSPRSRPYSAASARRPGSAAAVRRRPGSAR